MKKYNRRLKLTKEAIIRIRNLEWQGNELQLKRFTERLILGAAKRTIDEGTVQKLYDELYPRFEKSNETERLVVYKDPEAIRLREILDKYRGNRSEAAKELGISMTTLWRKMKKYGGAHRVKDVPGLSQISIDLKPRRSVSDVYINQKMDLTDLTKYIEKKKKAGESITYFHAFLTAIGKTIYNRPKLNYFIADRHIWEHDQISLSFVAKVNFDDSSEEVMIIIPIDPQDTIYSISQKVAKKVEGFRNRKKNKEGANSAIDILAKIPNALRVPLVGALKWCDKKGILPSSLAKDNLYYSTMIVSNLGSIRCGAILHNLNDFGNVSSLITMGEIKDERVLIEGKEVTKKICEWGMNFDERIADGYYFAKSAKLLQYLLSEPELLEAPVSDKIDLPELR